MKRLWLYLLVGITVLGGGGNAFAQRDAVMFIECEHEDQEFKSLGEVTLVWIANIYLGHSYDTFHWLINEDATRDGFMETMIHAVNTSPVVDLYLMAHGGTQYTWGHNDTRITSDDVLALGAFENMHHLRFVYEGSCYGYDQTDEFRAIGAESAIGNVALNSNEVFFPTFAAWFRKTSGLCGQDTSNSLKSAVQAARNAAALVKPMDFEINGDESLKITSMSEENDTTGEGEEGR